MTVIVKLKERLIRKCTHMQDEGLCGWERVELGIPKACGSVSFSFKLKPKVNEIPGRVNALRPPWVTSL